MDIVVIGAGYVGLVAAAGFASVNHRVVCVDIDAAKVDAINAGRPPLYESGLTALVQSARAQQTLRATTDLRSCAPTADVIFLCVETPSTTDGAIDLRAIRECAKSLGETLRDRQSYCAVAVKSTVVPGTTDEVVGPIIWASSGKQRGEIGLVANPEFLREGRAVQDFLHPDRVIIGGIDARSSAMVSASYAPFAAPVVTTNPRTAEIIKYAANALWATMISFSNEVANICEVTPDVDIEDVMAAIHLDERVAPISAAGPIKAGVVSYLRAGCGFGGSCLPKDVRALIRYAREAGADPQLLNAVMRVNGSRPQALVDLTERALGTLDRRVLAVLGLAFKPGTDDLRESSALYVIDELVRRGARVQAYDPVAGPGACVRWKSESQVRICSAVEDAIAGTEAAVVITAWPEFAALHWQALRQLMARPLIVDGRRLLDRGALERAGYQYLCVGRQEALATTEQTSPHISYRLPPNLRHRQ